MHRDISEFQSTSISIQNFSWDDLFIILVFIDSYENVFSFLLRLNTYLNINHFTSHCQDFKKQADLKKELNAVGECAQCKGVILF